jgi:hypothetical protein
MSRFRKSGSWWLRLKSCLRPTDRIPRSSREEYEEGHYWIGAPVGGLLHGPIRDPIVDAVFATHPDLLGLDVLLDRIARTEP